MKINSYYKSQTKQADIPCAIYTCGLPNEGLDQIFDSYKVQYDNCMGYIESQTHEGLVFTKSYGDVSRFDQPRDWLKQMLGDIKLGRIKCVIVDNLDIIYRDLQDFALLIEFFNKHQVSLILVSQNINTTKGKGKLILNILLCFANIVKKINTKWKVNYE